MKQKDYCPVPTVNSARKIITMYRNCPIATHAAVKNGLIVCVGGPDCGDSWGPIKRDTQLDDKVLGGEVTV